ncbi:hypothetical protein REPUB_Repub01dG0127800 [Reevesia pubescens]
MGEDLDYGYKGGYSSSGREDHAGGDGPVQRNSRPKVRKEELRKQELEAMKQRDEDLAREIEQLKQKLKS